jgi:hypothetical protein
MYHIGKRGVEKLEETRVLDPYLFFPDPDPEFDVGDQY